MWYSLEFCEGVTSQQGVVAAGEGHDVEEEFFGSVVVERAEHYIKGDTS